MSNPRSHMFRYSQWLTWAALSLGVVFGYGAAQVQFHAGEDPPDDGQTPVAQANAPHAPAQQPAKTSGQKPNILFILTDNLGYGEVGCYGGGILRGAPTPRIDKLAGEGV